MSRHSDLILVSACLAATAALVVLVRAKPADAPTSSTGPHADQFAATATALIPELEGHVVAGSTKARDGAPACLWDSRTRTARIDAVDQGVLDGTGFRSWSDPEARMLGESLHATLAPLRACVSCTPVKQGCADAARALVTLERRLAARQSTIGEPGGI